MEMSCCVVGLRRAGLLDEFPGGRLVEGAMAASVWNFISRVSLCLTMHFTCDKHWIILTCVFLIHLDVHFVILLLLMFIQYCDIRHIMMCTVRVPYLPSTRWSGNKLSLYHACIDVPTKTSTSIHIIGAEKESSNHIIYWL